MSFAHMRIYNIINIRKILRRDKIMLLYYHNQTI